MPYIEQCRWTCRRTVDVHDTVQSETRCASFPRVAFRRLTETVWGRPWDGRVQNVRTCMALTISSLLRPWRHPAGISAACHRNAVRHLLRRSTLRPPSLRPLGPWGRTARVNRTGRALLRTMHVRSPGGLRMGLGDCVRQAHHCLSDLDTDWLVRNQCCETDRPFVGWQNVESIRAHDWAKLYVVVLSWWSGWEAARARRSDGRSLLIAVALRVRSSAIECPTALKNSFTKDTTAPGPMNPVSPLTCSWSLNYSWQFTMGSA